MIEVGEGRQGECGAAWPYLLAGPRGCIPTRLVLQQALIRSRQARVVDAGLSSSVVQGPPACACGACDGVIGSASRRIDSPQSRSLSLRAAHHTSNITRSAIRSDDKAAVGWYSTKHSQTPLFVNLTPNITFIQTKQQTAPNASRPLRLRSASNQAMPPRPVSSSGGSRGPAAGRRGLFLPSSTSNNVAAGALSQIRNLVASFLHQLSVAMDAMLLSLVSEGDRLHR